MKKDRNRPRKIQNKQENPRRNENFPDVSHLPGANPKTQEVNLEQLFNSFSEIIFSNLKLHIDRKFQQIDPLFKEVDDIKINVATLSTLLGSKGYITQEEFTECFAEIQESFGIVNPDGTMKGNVAVTMYNSGTQKVNQEGNSCE